MSYVTQLENEIKTYQTVEQVSSLPEIHGYWAHTYILPLLSEFGFTNELEFYLKHIREQLDARPAGAILKILTLGCGNCELEAEIASALKNEGVTAFSIECVDVNPHMLERGKALAMSRGVEDFITFTQADINAIKISGKYGVIIANHSLHHFLKLEHIFKEIKQALGKDGVLLTHDMIGRNGHMRWPEALEILQDFWSRLPERCKYNHLLKRFEESYINFDCSVDGFEGVRAQDILPLLCKNFHFQLFVPFANVIDVFVDRCFGHNYLSANPWDKNLIDEIHRVDQESIEAGKITPTHMYAVLGNDKSRKTQVYKNLTPEFCIRDTAGFKSPSPATRSIVARLWRAAFK